MDRVPWCTVPRNQKRYSGLSNGEIGSLFGGIQHRAVTKTSSRVEEQMKKDVRIQELVDTIISKIKA